MATLFADDEVETEASIRIKAAFRPGNPRQDNSPWPLKVVLWAEGEAKAILQRTRNLKGTPVRFLRDLDTEQHSKLKTALEELRERRAKGETDHFIRDFRIHHPQLRWLPLVGGELRRLFNHGPGDQAEELMAK
ncbi:unnamed protein product [Echinostoma caproni]|uniref:DUF5681 domain-containing protein n=1 Tax=Echinostoma caproni TaxID=27848 RepID=A0A183A5R5_9TREM|nr:unnamed protein product [Echinostoma caproni]